MTDKAQLPECIYSCEINKETLDSKYTQGITGNTVHFHTRMSATVIYANGAHMR